MEGVSVWAVNGSLASWDPSALDDKCELVNAARLEVVAAWNEDEGDVSAVVYEDPIRWTGFSEGARPIELRDLQERLQDVVAPCRDYLLDFELTVEVSGVSGDDDDDDDSAVRCAGHADSKNIHIF